MFRLILASSIHIRQFLRVCMPSIILLDAIRTWIRLMWGLPALLIAVPYVVIALWCTTLIVVDGPGWLHLIVLVACWSGLKFMIMGPVSVILLAKTRLGGHRARRREKRSPDEAGPRPLVAVGHGRTRRAPTGYEALPDHEHRPTYLGRGSGAYSA